MFKDLAAGQTYRFQDGCGEPGHNYKALSIPNLLSLIEELCLNEGEKNELAMNIYRFVHSHTEHTCHILHQDWRDEAVELYKKLTPNL